MPKYAFCCARKSVTESNCDCFSYRNNFEANNFFFFRVGNLQSILLRESVVEWSDFVGRTA